MRKVQKDIERVEKPENKARMILYVPQTSDLKDRKKLRNALFKIEGFESPVSTSPKAMCWKDTTRTAQGAAQSNFNLKI
jgi:hypothetical protein